MGSENIALATWRGKEYCIRYANENIGLAVWVELTKEEWKWIQGGDKIINGIEIGRRLREKALEKELVSQEFIERLTTPQGRVINKKKKAGVPKGFPKGYKRVGGLYYILNRSGEVVRVRNFMGYDISDWLTEERFWLEMKMFGGRN